MQHQSGALIWLGSSIYLNACVQRRASECRVKERCLTTSDARRLNQVAHFI